MSTSRHWWWEGYAALACVPWLLLAWLNWGLLFTWSVTILPVFFGLVFAISGIRSQYTASRACACLAIALIAGFIFFIFLPASRAY
jgi:hypothetical protein